MSEQRLIDVNKIELHHVVHDMGGYADLSDVEDYINTIPTIDPETLPIVKELREEIDMRVRDAKRNSEAVQYWINYARKVEKKLRVKLAECEPKHGHWIEFDVQYEVVNQCGKNYMSIRKKVKCSLCGKHNKNYKPPYCPHCGAKMDQEV